MHVSDYATRGVKIFGFHITYNDYQSAERHETILAPLLRSNSPLLLKSDGV